MKFFYAIPLIGGLLLLLSCNKEADNIVPAPEPAAPEMLYIPLHNQVVRYAGPSAFLDLNQDGRSDFLFDIWLVGDPILQQDKFQFRVNGGINSMLLVDMNERTPALKRNDRIPVGNPTGYEWNNVTSIMLAQKIISMAPPARWEGDWLGLTDRYLPFQIVSGGLRYNGYISFTMNTSLDQLVLHRAAISKYPEVDVLAGR